jgi:hypothetical protein
MKKWIDEAGHEIPAKYVTKTQKLMEKNAAKVLSEALKVNKQLKKLKELINDASMEVFDSIIEERKQDKSKRKQNFTWYNFDRSIKIEMQDSENAKYDDLYVTSATEKLMKFLDLNVNSSNEFIKPLILDALRTTNGQLDSRKINTLIKYKDKVHDKLFTSACEDLQEGYRLVKSKLYFKVYKKNDNGEYEPIELNFSAIKI